jgi:hypothetical protein
VDTYGTDRLAAKNVESATVERIVEDFNLTPILFSRAQPPHPRRHLWVAECDL